MTAQQTDNLFTALQACDFRPLIVVAFTGPAPAALIDAIARTPARLSVATRPSPSGEGGPARSGGTGGATASLEAAMREATLVVTDGDRRAVAAAIAHGVPLLCLPADRDGIDATARVAAEGAALRLDPRADADAIEAAIRRIFAGPDIRSAARRLRDAARRLTVAAA